jgi:hypothetical protein
MRCDVVQRQISESMDEHNLVVGEVERHVASCSACASFRSRAWRLRQVVRLGEAPPVPDLVDDIMARVHAEAPAERTLVPLRRFPAGRVRTAVATRVAVAALVVGLVLLAVLGRSLAAAAATASPAPAATAGSGA